MDEEKQNKVGEGIDALSGAVESAMVEISGSVGGATVGISRTMVKSAKEIAEVSQAFVDGAGRLARAKAAGKFHAMLEQAQIEYLEELAERRASFEEKAKSLPSGSSARKFALAMVEKIGGEENQVLESAMQGGGIAGGAARIDGPIAALPGSDRPAVSPGVAKPFAKPPGAPVPEEAAEEIEDAGVSPLGPGSGSPSGHK